MNNMTNNQTKCHYEKYSIEWLQHPANKRAKWLMILFVWMLVIVGGLMANQMGIKCDDRTGDDCYEQSFDYYR